MSDQRQTSEQTDQTSDEHEQTDEPTRAISQRRFETLWGLAFVTIPGVFLVAAWLRSAPAPPGPTGWTVQAIPVGACLLVALLLLTAERRKDNRDDDSGV